MFANLFYSVNPLCRSGYLFDKLRIARFYVLLHVFLVSVDLRYVLPYGVVWYRIVVSWLFM